MSSLEELKERILIEAQTTPIGAQLAVSFDPETLKANEEAINKIERDMGYKL